MTTSNLDIAKLNLKDEVVEETSDSEDEYPVVVIDNGSSTMQ